MAPLSDGERRRESARRGQKRAMEGRKCPRCGRGNALTKDVWRDSNGRIGWMGRHCRYCDYARGDWV